MDTFPEDFTLAKCMKIIEDNQRQMTNQVRKEFHDKTMQAAHDCEPHIQLVFPKNHWPVHKTKIATELLDIFGEIETITHNKKTNSTVSTPITEAANISNSIDCIIIRFRNE